jgi:hypothetical protein
MTTAVRPPRWTAAKDGIAHAHRPGWRRAVCGALAVDEQFAWPKVRRCGRCVAIVEGADS